ncbi:hypothetical protein GCM10028798_13890 [Humibacter antri]
MALQYTCLIQSQWFEAPRTAEESAGLSAELDRLVETPDARATLELAAERLVQQVAKDDHPDRHTWGGVGDRALGDISAVMTIEPVKARGVDLDQFLTAWTQADPGEGLDIWLRDFQKKEIAGRRAVSGHEILQAPEGENGERMLTETYRAAVAAPGLATFMLVTITTDDLSIFDDIVGYGDTVAETFEFETARGMA